jgi:hypothetical protein
LTAEDAAFIALSTLSVPDADARPDGQESPLVDRIADELAEGEASNG